MSGNDPHLVDLSQCMTPSLVVARESSLRQTGAIWII